jgi:pSer/pThr/pTyr-binding forkhead associated (FHA) protein
MAKKRRYPVEGEEAVLGRDEGLPVSLALEGVSRQHARVVRDKRGWWLEDLQSTNGTFLNGQRTRRARLRHLDVITLGRAVDLLFLLRDPGAASGMRRGIVRAGLLGEAGRYEVAVGEATLGRSPACNLVIDNEAVSKRHARLERTVDQLVLRDLGSANGTLVNGEPVQVAVLKDGDTVALAGVEALKVSIEMGDVLSASGARTSLSLIMAKEAPFSRDWQTRYEWDPAEMAAFEAVRRGEAPPEAKPKPPTPPPPSPPRPAAPVKPPAPAPAPRPPAAPPRPAAPSKPPAAPSKPPAAPPPKPPAAPTPPPPAPTPPPPAPPPPPTPPPSTPPPPEPVGPPTLAMEAPSSLVVRSIHLRTRTAEQTVTEPGSYLMGRASDVALRFEDNTVSRRHATLLFGADRRTVEVRHDGGANGTFVNGVQVEGAPHPLANGDELRLGHFVLRVRIK